MTQQNSMAQNPVPKKPKPRKTGLIVTLILILLLVAALIVGYFTVHIWQDRTCTEPETCLICGITEGRSAGHDWEDADCVHGQVCDECGKERGKPLGHLWSGGSCVSPAVCSRCGKEDQGTQPHQFAPATYTDPATCSICGQTEGERLKPEPVYIHEMDRVDQYGKLWHHEDKAYRGGNTQYDDYSQPGYLKEVVMDNQGNVYTYGLHMDGYGKNSFYLTYDLDGKYTSFTFSCVLPYSLKDTMDTKNFEVYCDGELVFTTNTMRAGCQPQNVTLDVSGVERLTILYPPTAGSNEVAMLCDGLLE